MDTTPRLRLVDPIVDPDLLRRHDRPGPRYTSYPTAPQFSGDCGEDAFVRAAQASNEDPIPRRLSLYVHVPFCLSPCFYCGCHRIITRDTSRAERHLAYLLKEARQLGPLFDDDREVVQLHIGGGTPNFLSAEQLGRLMQGLGEHFRLSGSPRRDFSIELDPRTVAPGEIQALARIGFNRISLGVQDIDPGVQAAINRIQPLEQTQAVVHEARAAGLRSINLDLIYGLPKQTLDTFARTVDAAIEMRPERLAVYGYAHMPSLFKAQKQIDEATLPDAEARLALLALAVERLGAAGYTYIGMDHFALPDDELARAQRRGDLHRNFMGYTTHADCDLVGLGPSAISYIGDTYAQNVRELPIWEAELDAGRLGVMRGKVLDADDLVRADLIQDLMCHARIDIRALERQHGVVFEEYFADALPALDGLAADGLLERSPDAIVATPRGRMLLRIIAMPFDRYLQRPGEPVRFSKAV
jgi:oxygen-independent coproporphyrinogen-3 oxidase